MKERVPRPVRAASHGRPIIALLDLAGRRWMLRIVWELRDTSLTFRSLQAACGEISPTVLNDRLRDLREAGIVENTPPDGYGLTAIGKDLVSCVVPLVGWSERWARAVEAS